MIVFDLETGGVEPGRPIIQLAAARVKPVEWKILDTFEVKLLFQESEATQEALAVNHYDREVWKREGLPPEEAFGGFAAWVKKDGDIVRRWSQKTGNPYYVARSAAYNAHFDIGFLMDAMTALRKFGRAIYIPIDTRPLCLKQLAEWYFYFHETKAVADPLAPVELRRPKRLTLDAVTKFFGISLPGDAKLHDALNDVRMTVALARVLTTSFGVFKAERRARKA